MDSATPAGPSLFDELGPDLIGKCIRCGSCVETCPTYVLRMEDDPFAREGWNEPKPSPRGRVNLTKLLLEGRSQLDDDAVELIDSCLGCMACLTSCPQKVQHDELLEVTRAHVHATHKRPLGDRLVRGAIFQLFPHPRRMRLALALQPLSKVAPVPKRLKPLVELAPPWRVAGNVPALTPAVGERRMRVGLLTGCVQSVVFGDVNEATVRVLAADGCDVAVPKQGCCGGLALHVGRLEDARKAARRTIDAFEGADVEWVISNAAGCGSAMKEYGRLLADDPLYAERAAAFSARVRDISEALAKLGPQAERHPLGLSVAYQDACHLNHAQRVKRQPRRLFGKVPELSLVEVEEQALCCGSAGIYNIVEPETARRLGDRKAGHVIAAGADVYATGNPGCLLQVSSGLRRAGVELPVIHTIELVDASIRGIPAAAFLAAARRSGR